jgi:hypothetical protein
MELWAHPLRQQGCVVHHLEKAGCMVTADLNMAALSKLVAAVQLQAGGL